MGADKHIVDVRTAENLHARIHELCADAHREHAANHAADDGEDEVHRADVLVIGRIGPPPPAMRAIVVDGFCWAPYAMIVFLAFASLQSRATDLHLESRSVTSEDSRCRTSASGVFG